jgi:hypothetical protein
VRAHEQEVRSARLLEMRLEFEALATDCSSRAHLGTRALDQGFIVFVLREVCAAAVVYS